MLVLIPIVVVLAGIALLYTHRRYKASKSKEPSRVVVQGHTFSESVEQKPATDVRKTGNRIDTVRQCCVVGAGRVGESGSEPTCRFVSSNQVRSYNGDCPRDAESRRPVLHC